MNKKIVLIVGASGVGKDTLLKEIKKDLKANFVRRYITRKPDENEDNYFLEKEAFLDLEKNKFFCSTWQAHGNFYGISFNALQEGLNIISISRSVIKDFEKVFDEVFTINITLDKDELRQRLINRKRENLEQIEKRLNRSYEKLNATTLIEFENNKPIKESAKEFRKILENI